LQRGRIIGISIIAVAVIAILAYGFRPQPVMVDTARVTRQPLKVTVEEEGKTRVKDRFVISAPVAGYAQRVELDVGDAVTRGQRILMLEPLRPTVLDPRNRAEAEARVAAAKAALEVAQQDAQAIAASADLAQLELERIQRLRKSQHATKDEEDRAMAEARRADAALRSARFAVEVAKHQLQAAETALKYSAARTNGDKLEKITISSPIDGEVLKIHRESEGVVEAGQALLEVGNPHALEVEVDVLSPDAVRIKPGTRVLFNRWGGDQSLEGRVRVVEPVGFTKISALGVEEQRVLVIADITTAPKLWEQLGDGYRVEASFILWESDNVLQIPASALFRYQGGWAVFTVDDDRAQRRQVTIGNRNGLQAQVMSGLNEGDTVIIHPGDEIDHDTRVEPR
jgi:HlyD family secretion protein